MSILRPLRRADRKPNKSYLGFVRGLPCLICSLLQERQQTITEAAHSGPHAMGSKSDDRTALPLCALHHREGVDSYHRVGERRFQQIHSVSIADVVTGLNEMYDARVLAEGRPESVLNAREVAGIDA